MEMIKPIVIKDKETSEEFVLEFNRESVKFAEDRGFSMDDVGNKPMTGIPDLFFYAFRMHHKNVARDKTDKILFDKLGGLTSGMIERLGQLYAAPFDCLISDEDAPKNSKMTVEM